MSDSMFKHLDGDEQGSTESQELARQAIEDLEREKGCIGVIGTEE